MTDIKALRPMIREELLELCNSPEKSLDNPTWLSPQLVSFDARGYDSRRILYPDESAFLVINSWAYLKLGYAALNAYHNVDAPGNVGWTVTVVLSAADAILEELNAVLEAEAEQRRREQEKVERQYQAAVEKREAERRFKLDMLEVLVGQPSTILDEATQLLKDLVACPVTDLGEVVHVQMPVALLDDLYAALV